MYCTRFSGLLVSTLKMRTRELNKHGRMWKWEHTDEVGDDFAVTEAAGRELVLAVEAIGLVMGLGESEEVVVVAHIHQWVSQRERRRWLPLPFHHRRQQHQHHHCHHHSSHLSAASNGLVKNSVSRRERMSAAGNTLLVHSMQLHQSRGSQSCEHHNPRQADDIQSSNGQYRYRNTTIHC